MSRAAKRLAQMRANPQGDWKMDDVETVATAFAISVRKSGGSHVVLSHSSVSTRLTIPARRPIKTVYIRMFVALLDEIRGL